MNKHLYIEKSIKIFICACCLFITTIEVQAQTTSSGNTIVLSDNNTTSGVGWRKVGNVFEITGDVTITGTTTTNRGVIKTRLYIPGSDYDYANITLNPNYALGNSGKFIG